MHRCQIIDDVRNDTLAGASEAGQSGLSPPTAGFSY
jgi:hypothetical protein